MARVLTTDTTAQSYVEDPAPGTILVAAAGGQAEAEFNFNNDSPDVAAFSLEVADLPPAWLSGVGAQHETLAAAFGGSSLRLSLVPPLDADPGDYDYQVSILCSGSPLAPPLPLVLRVSPAAESLPLLTESLPLLTESLPLLTESLPLLTESLPLLASPLIPLPDSPVAVATPEISTPPLKTPRRVVRKPEPVSAEEATEEAAPEVVPEAPVLVFASAPSAVEEAPPVVSETPPPLPLPLPLPPPPVSRPVPRLVPARLSPPPPLEAPEDEPVLVDMAAPLVLEPEQDVEDEVKADAERAVRNPEEGQILLVRPAETLLVRFQFTNDAPRTRTFILDEDQSLGDHWLTLVQDQVNLTRNGTGEVSLRLSPPADAAPGDYPFSVTVGPEGGPLTLRQLILSVQSIPAVRLTAKAVAIKIGPLASAIDFPLVVESAGNAETAFRLGVQAPQSQSNTEDTVGRREYRYDAPNWRYLFDKELDTLRSPSAGRTPRPVPISLRLQRRGIWWLGWTETHTVQVAAVPVTDPANGGKAGNEMRLTATRWRILPFPSLLLIPIVFLALLLLSGGASNLEITNAQHFDDNYYILQSQNIKEDPGKPAIPMTAHLQWSAPWYALLSLKAATDNKVDTKGFVHGSATEPYAVAEYGKDRTYTVSPLLVAGNASVTARFVPVRTQNKLKLSYGSRLAPLETGVSDLQSGDTTISNGQASATVVVPRSGTLRLNLENTTPASSGLRIDVWVVHLPSAYSVNNVTLTNNNPITPGQTITAQIKARPDKSTSDDQDLTLVTTDAEHQVLHIHLKAGR